MKKLGKLTINPDKIIKNEELVNLRGGYDCGYIQCRCGNIQQWIGTCFTSPYPNDPENAQAALQWAASICAPEVVTCGPTCPGGE